MTSRDRIQRFALVSQVALALYLQVVEWIPLWRWNNIKNGNGQESLDIGIAALQLAILLVFWKRWRWLMAVGTVLYGWWGYLEVTSWWVPYFFGASPQWMKVYQKWFASTYKLLPAIGDHPIPDAEHTVLLFLILVVVAFALASTIRAFHATTNQPGAELATATKSS